MSKSAVLAIFLQGCSSSEPYLRNGKILIESKADIKKRLGNSPDRADCYVNGLYALQFVEGQLVGGRVSYEDFEDSPYCGGYSAMGM